MLHHQYKTYLHEPADRNNLLAFPVKNEKVNTLPHRLLNILFIMKLINTFVTYIIQINNLLVFHKFRSYQHALCSKLDGRKEEAISVFLSMMEVPI